MEKVNLKHFLKNLLIFVLVILAVDRIFGFALDKLYFGLKTGQFAQNTYAFDKASPNLLIFGSSRALRHYSTPILSNQLDLSVYNAGRDGQFLPYYCASLDVILERKIPKIIILDVNIWELGPNESKYFKLASLLPYVGKYPILEKYTAEISTFENLKLWSKTYPYNSTLLISVYDHLNSAKLPQDDRGYTPLVRNVSKKEYLHYKETQEIYNQKRAKQTIKIDEKAIKYYRQFLNKTASLNIKTLVIISPTILKEPNSQEKTLLERIAKEYKNVTFLDYTNNPQYNNKFNLFADEFHLNKEGAELFSKDIVQKVIN